MIGRMLCDVRCVLLEGARAGGARRRQNIRGSAYLGERMTIKDWQAR